MSWLIKCILIMGNVVVLYNYNQRYENIGLHSELYRGTGGFNGALAERHAPLPLPHMIFSTIISKSPQLILIFAPSFPHPGYDNI